MDHLSLLDLPDLLNMHINALKKDKRTKKKFALSRPGIEPGTFWLPAKRSAPRLRGLYWLQLSHQRSSLAAKHQEKIVPL